MSGIVSSSPNVLKSCDMSQFAAVPSQILQPSHAPSCACPVERDPQQAMKNLGWALVLIVGVAIAEGIGGWLSHSLALVAESVHMISDAVALGVALIATVLANRPRSNSATFGYRRIEILAALVNGVGLVAIALWIGWEAVEHLQAPGHDLLSTPMLIVAGLGCLVSTLNARLLHPHSHQDLNVRGAFLHMMADAASSVGILLAAIAIWLWHWVWIDSVIGLGVAGLILVSAIALIRQSIPILLEQAPSHLSIEQLQAYLLQPNAVQAIAQLRLWTVAPGYDVLAAHLLIYPIPLSERDRLLADLQTSLQQNFGLAEIYLQCSPITPLVNLSSPPKLDQAVSAIANHNPVDHYPG